MFRVRDHHYPQVKLAEVAFHHSLQMVIQFDLTP